MSVKEDILEMHTQAMLFAQDAVVAKARGSKKEAKDLFEKAYELEISVIELLENDDTNIITKAIIYKSAASIAINCENFLDAEKLIQTGLSIDPPPEIIDELNALLSELSSEVLQANKAGKKLLYSTEESNKYKKAKQEPATRLLENIDAEEFTHINKHYFERLNAFAKKMILNKADAEEIVLDAMYKLFEHQKFNSEKEIKQYLYTAVRNACLNRLKDQKQKRSAANTYLNLQEKVDPIDIDAYLNRMNFEIDKAIKKLRPRPKSVIELYLMGRNPKEIADQLAISINLVYKYKAEAIKLIRDVISKYDT